MKLCIVCFKQWKKSKQGKLARVQNGGTWKGMQWPSHLYQTSENRLCPIHQHEADAKLRRIYEARELVVASLGFLSYKAYLGSKLWKDIRQRVLATTEGKCKYCGRIATQVHHSSYDKKTMIGERITDLHPVCITCHENGEYFAKGGKAHPRQATRRMKHNSESNRQGAK